MSLNTTPHDGGASMSVAFHRAVPAAALVGIAALLLAGVWWLLVRPGTDVPVIPVAVSGGIALLAAVVALRRRRNPVSLLSVTAHLVGLLGSAVVFGALRGSPSGALAAVAGLVFFVMAVVSTVLRAEGAGVSSQSRFD